MKKKIITAAAVGLLAALCIPVAACSGPAHEHTFATGWEHDATNHWHAATCEHTEEVSGKATHTPGEWQLISESTATVHGRREKACTECGYVTDIEELPLKDPNPITALGFSAHGENSDLGVEGEELEDGSYKVTVAHPDDENWHVKLESHYNFTVGKKYKITITLKKSVVTGNIWIEASGSTSPAISLTADEEKTVDYTFTATSNDYVCVQLGKGTEAFDVIFKEIKFEEVGESTNPITTMGLNAWSYTENGTDLGVTGEELADGGYKIKATNPDGEAWHIKLDGNLDLTNGKKYKITVKAVSTVNNTFKFVNGANNDTKEFTANEESTWVYEFTADGKYLCVELGATHDAFEVTFKEVKLEEVEEAATTNPITDMGLNAWSYTENGTDLGVTGEELADGGYKIKATNPDGEAWHIKLDGNLDLTNGKKYKITVKAVSTVNNTFKFVNGANNDTKEFTANEESAWVYEFTADGKYLCVELGATHDAFEIVFKQVKLEEVEEAATTNPINVEGLHAWSFTENDTNLGVTGAETEEGYYKITATNPDGEAWHIKLEGDLNVENGKKYKLTFTAVSTVGGNIKALTSGAEKLQLLEANEEATFELEFTATGQYMCVEVGEKSQAFEIVFKQVKLEEVND